VIAMRNDIVVRLREADFSSLEYIDQLMYSAAAEIERLRLDADRWRECASAYHAGDQSDGARRYEEARRG
jgi:hypothetical protein